MTEIGVGSYAIRQRRCARPPPMTNPLSLRPGDRVLDFALGSTAAAQIHLIAHRRAGEQWWR